MCPKLLCAMVFYPVKESQSWVIKCCVIKLKPRVRNVGKDMLSTHTDQSAIALLVANNIMSGNITRVFIVWVSRVTHL